MSFATIRTEVKAFLESASGIGRVHDFIRHTQFWDEYFSRHVDNMQVNDWEITRSSAQEIIDTVGGAVGNEPCFQDRHNIRIIGHLGVTDEKESEKQFQDLIDAIVSVFRADPLLNDTLLLPIQIATPIISHEMFGGVLCHAATLEFEAVERVSG